jgi:hypothetical protein
MTRDEHKAIIDNIRDTAGEQAGALISDSLLTLLSDYASMITTGEDQAIKIAGLEKDNMDLILANGKLFQRIGTEEKPIDETPAEAEEKEISIEEIVNEKGEMV